MRAFGWLLLLALLLRLGFIAATPGYAPAHDDRRYARLGCAIALSGQYPLHTPQTTRDGCGEMPAGANAPTAFRPPAYPALLAGVHALGGALPGGYWSDGRVVNALLGTLAVALTGLIAWRLWGRRVALAAAAVAALSPPLIVVGGSLHSDLLFAVLVLAAVAAALRSGDAARWLPWVACAGVLVGLSALTRPTGLVLLAPLILAVAWRPWRPAAALALCLAAVATIAPWTARNAVQMGAFIPVSTHVGSWLAGTYNQQAREDPEHPASSQMRVGAFADLDGVPEVERQRALTRRALAYARDHPGYVGGVLFHNTARMLNLEGPRRWRPQADLMSLPAWAGDVAAYGFFCVLALALAGALTARARAAPRWLWLVPALLFLAVIVAGSEVRYRAPVEPFLALLAGLALVWASERARARPGQERAAAPV